MTEKKKKLYLTISNYRTDVFFTLSLRVFAAKFKLTFTSEDTMARRTSKTLTEVELEFMQIIWEHEEVSTENVRNSLAQKERKLSDGAIRRVLAILMDKGYLERRREGIGFYYSAKVKKKHAYNTIFQDLLTRAFDGSGSLMVAALLDSLDVKNGEMDEIRRLIEEKERRDRK